MVGKRLGYALQAAAQIGRDAIQLQKAEKVDQKIQAIEKTLQQIGINP